MKKSILFMTSFIFILSFAIQAQEKNEVIWEKIDDVTIPVPPRYTLDCIYSHPTCRS